MTATQDPETRSSSRRARLAGALSGIGAWAATVIGRPSSVRAGVDGDLILETGNTTTSATGINGGGFYVNNSNGNGQIAIGATRSGPSSSPSWAVNAANTQQNGVAVSATSSSGVGVDASGEPAVHAVASMFAVDALAVGGAGSAAVHGRYTGTSAEGAAIQGLAVDFGTGVRGDAPKRAVVGTVNGGGVGVYGYSQELPGYPSPIGSLLPANVGVAGESNPANARGVLGITAYGTGVMGATGNVTAPPKAKTGVYGITGPDTTAVGVWGESPAGFGLYGKTTGTGFAGYFNGKVFMSQFVEIAEMTTPAAPGGNRARLFVRDNGLGKTQLCVRFPTGAVKVLATES